MNTRQFCIRQLLERKTITIVQVVIIAVVTFVLTILITFTTAIEKMGARSDHSRLVVQNNFSIMRTIPDIYQRIVGRMDDVTATTHVSWLGAYYKQKNNMVTALAVQTDQFFNVYHEYELDDTVREKFKRTNNAIIVGEQLAKENNWKPGSTISLGSDVFPKKNGDTVWQFQLVGLFRSPDNPHDEEKLFINYAYFDSERMYGQHQISWVIVKAASDADVYALTKKIESRFSGSPNEVSVMTEDNISKSYVGQVEDMKNMSVLIISVAVASMLIVVLSALLHYIDSNSDIYRLMRYFGIRKSRVIALSLQRVSILLISGCALGLFFGYITIFVLGDKLVSVLPGLTIEFMNYYLYLVILLVATILIGSAAIKTQSVIRI